MSDLKEAVEAARQRWNAGDLDGYLALYDPAIKLYGYAPEPFDRAAVRAFYEMIFGSLSPAGKPSPHLEFHETMVEGDLYTCRFTMTGAQSGSFLGFPASGKPYGSMASRSCVSGRTGRPSSNAIPAPTCSACSCRSAR